ncbi:endonuclease/exonuclease/phosphatase family protein [Hazenella sp. IB182357]|uniref:Endonuclease/exonuclease/phosphatase family protein n=1 Tax=Polycladospora coralii TaxID=2771432 RepID=A0A926N759_9BACL|nr:endonuclease/exonuclease/phosphatase family protein [Polycladospora coralii]MBD1373121.1 endonuclease/exonuclease/phosphatase family protein [Polycladospora coralii]MBS7531679.1 endonuclease/exonuclease/phosphatase family protein [Polycladospora coralii]
MRSKMKALSILLIVMCLFAGPFFTAHAQEETDTFSLLTYNVAGLWDPISQSNPAKNTSQISPKLNDYDIVLTQEDWNYHRDLVAEANHPYQSQHSGIMGIGDGLNRLSKFPFTAHTRESWNACSGIWNNLNDCLTPKGFSFARHQIANHLYVDIYNLHADAGTSSQDEDARNNNFQQILAKIEQWSSGHAVIVTGDFNSHYFAENQARYFIDAGFSDAWVDIEQNGQFPAIGAYKGSESIDKIIYRSGDHVRLQALSHTNPENDFKDQNGNDLSDHDPRAAVFQYQLQHTAAKVSPIALRSAHSTYVVAENSGGSQVNANRTRIGDWEKFEIRRTPSDSDTCIKNGDQVSIRTSGGYYLRAKSSGGLDARALQIGNWERFHLVNHSDASGCLANGDQVSLKSTHGKYVVAESDGRARANRDQIGAWEKFVVEIQ